MRKKTPSTSERKRRKNLRKREKTTTSERKRKIILKNEEKQQRFFLELLKQALLKSLSNNQPTDSTTIFTQNRVWNALETFSYAPDEDKTFEEYCRRYEDILPTVPIGLMQKMSDYFYES